MGLKRGYLSAGAGVPPGGGGQLPQRYTISWAELDRDRLEAFPRLKLDRVSTGAELRTVARVGNTARQDWLPHGAWGGLKN